MRTKTKSAILGLLLLCTISAACPANPPPELKPLYTAESVLIRVQELQNFVGGLVKQKQIDLNKAELIVTFTRESAVVLKDAKVGWAEVIKSSWKTLKSKVVPDPNYKTVWDALDAMVGAI